MTAPIIKKLELTNQLQLLHNHLIETCQIIQDFLDIGNGVVPDSGETLSLKYTLSKFAIKMSSFTSSVTRMTGKLNKHQEEESEDHDGHHDNVDQQQDCNLLEENKDKRKNSHTFTPIKTEELEIEELPLEEDEEDNLPYEMEEVEPFPVGDEGYDEHEEQDEEDYQEDDEEEELPYEMEEVEPFPVGDEGYDEHDEEQEKEDYNFNDEDPGTSSASEYDMHPVHVEYSAPPNFGTTGRKSSSRKQTIRVRNFDESPIVPRSPPPPKKKMIARPPMWNGRPVSLSTLRVIRFRSRMTEEQKIEQRRKDRERVARKRTALRAARAIAQGVTNGSSESYESLCIKRKNTSP